MFPIRDENPQGGIPFVNILIILVTSFIFFLQITAPDFEQFINAYALIPQNVNFASPSTLLPFVYSIFLHGGWMHIISNLWFLWVFGDNIENRFGHFFYLVFYLITGLAAGFTQYLI